jgi:AcrR family transcriptional regulator
MAKSARRAAGAAHGRPDSGPNRDAEPPDGAPRTEAHHIVEAALARIARDGWRQLSLAAIAEEATVPLLRVYRNFRSKQAILVWFMRRIDETVLAEPPLAEGDERPRDRLFDLLMRRFDALGPYKPALAVLRRELPGDPAAALCLGAALLGSMRWMLEAADIATGGVRGAIAVRLTGAAYLATMRVWQRDEAPDLGQTMAALDARLRRIERWLPPARTPGGNTATARA